MKKNNDSSSHELISSRKISFHPECGPECGPAVEDESDNDNETAYSAVHTYSGGCTGPPLTASNSSDSLSSDLIAAPPPVIPHVFGAPVYGEGAQANEGEGTLHAACRTVPLMASTCFALVATGVALAFHAAVELDKALKEFGAGAEELRRYSTKYLSISLGVSAIINWTALLQNCLASGRARELLFTKTPKELVEEEKACCPQCCMGWYCVRPTQLVLFLSFVAQLVISFMDVAAACIVMALDAICQAGKPARKSFQHFIDLLFDNNKEPGFSWKWASTFRAEEYCDKISDIDRVAKQLVLSCIAIIIGQGAMMACLSWSRERVRSQELSPPKDCVGFITTEELEEHARRITEIHAVAAAQQTQAKELLENEKRRTKDFSRMSQRKIEEMAIQIEELQEVLDDHGIKQSDSDRSEEGESEAEDADSPDVTEASGGEDTEDPRAPLCGTENTRNSDFNFDVKDGEFIPPRQEIALEDARANVGLCGSIWCNTRKC